MRGLVWARGLMPVESCCRASGRSARQEGGLVTGSGEVLLEVDGGVAIVTQNAPERRNALTPAMADELIATFDEVDSRSEVGALVIRAVGRRIRYMV